jgi:hypothetical protein
LEQQCLLGIGTNRVVEEDDLHPASREFFDEQNLIRIFARQSIWREHVEPIDDSSGGLIAEALKCGADQCTSTIPVVHEAKLWVTV